MEILCLDGDKNGSLSLQLPFSQMQLDNSLKDSTIVREMHTLKAKERQLLFMCTVAWSPEEF